MKRTLVLLIGFMALFLIHSAPQQQKGGSSGEAAELVCLSLEDAKAQGIDVNKLRQSYPPAFSGDPQTCVFPGRADEVMKGFLAFVTQLSDHVKRNNRQSFKDVIVFNMVYFNGDGKIEYYFFRCESKNKMLPDAICRAVREIAADFRFPLKAEKNFSQCGKFKLK